jgi:anaerobic magnesium-protoporphyrin IX monomethyl ester cyclase
LSEIPGIFYKEKNQIKNGQPLRVIKNIDKILFPARHLVEKYDYGKINGSFFFKHRFTTMLTSRGCPSRCRFCARYGNIIEGWGSRMRSTENILAEFKEISKRYNSVMIVDDNFLISKNRAHNIMDEIIKQVLDFEIYIQGARVDTAEKELYKKMKKAGVRLIEFGIESGNQDVLEFYNKKTTVDDIKKAVNLSSKTGFITFGTFIFGAPFETQKHIENTIDFACSLPLDIAVFYPLHYTMGSDLWNEAVKNKKIRQEEYIVTSDKKRGLGNFSADELENFTRYATKRFYQRPKFYFQQFYKTIIRKDMRLLRTGLKFIKN